MKKAFLYSAELLLLSVILLVIVSAINSNIDLSDTLWLTLSFYTATLTSLIIFLRGQARNTAESQAFYTFISVSLKFLFELVIAFFWFLFAKNNSLSFILLFFVLYLTFTLFLIYIILKTLKNKPLNSKQD